MTEEQKTPAVVSNEPIDAKPLVAAGVKEEEKTAGQEKPAETAPPTEQPIETKPEEVKPAEAAPEVAKPVEVKPVEAKPEEVKAEETAVKVAEKPAEEEMKTEFLDESDEAKPAAAAGEEEKSDDTTVAPANPPPSMRNVKIARIPKEIFDFMVKDEAEEGTVRVNVTQLRYFIQEELWKLAKYVNGSVWDKCDFPVLDMLVPENAQKYLTVQTFNTMKIKEEEKRIGSENEKFKKLDANTYQKMNNAHRKKCWADLERKFTVKDNIIGRTGVPHNAPPETPSPKKKTPKPQAPPKNVSQIQPAVPVEGAAAKPAKTGAKPGAPAKAVPAAQNGTNNKSDSARKRPQATAAAESPAVPTKKNKPQETSKSQGQKNFPKKGNFNNSGPRFNNNSGPRFNNNSGGNQRNNGPQRYGRFEAQSAQPWSNPMAYAAPRPYPAFREPAPVPAPMGYTPSFDMAIAERERALAERERRLLAAETQMSSTGFATSTYGANTGGDYRTTYDNYTNSAFGGATAAPTAAYGSSSYGSTAYGSTSNDNYANNYNTSSSTYGSFLSTYGGAMDNNQAARRRSNGRR